MSFTFEDCHENFKSFITFFNQNKIKHYDLNNHIFSLMDFWNDYTNKSINEIYKLKEHHDPITQILVETKEDELKVLWANYLTSMCELRCNLLRILRK